MVLRALLLLGLTFLVNCAKGLNVEVPLKFFLDGKELQFTTKISVDYSACGVGTYYELKPKIYLNCKKGASKDRKPLDLTFVFDDLMSCRDVAERNEMVKLEAVDQIRIMLRGCKLNVDSMSFGEKQFKRKFSYRYDVLDFAEEFQENDAAVPSRSSRHRDSKQQKANREDALRNRAVVRRSLFDVADNARRANRTPPLRQCSTEQLPAITHPSGEYEVMLQFFVEGGGGLEIAFHSKELKFHGHLYPETHLVCESGTYRETFMGPHMWFTSGPVISISSISVGAIEEVQKIIIDVTHCSGRKKEYPERDPKLTADWMKLGGKAFRKSGRVLPNGMVFEVATLEAFDESQRKRNGRFSVSQPIQREDDHRRVSVLQSIRRENGHPRVSLLQSIRENVSDVADRLFFY